MWVSSFFLELKVSLHKVHLYSWSKDKGCKYYLLIDILALLVYLFPKVRHLVKLQHVIVAKCLATDVAFVRLFTWKCWPKLFMPRQCMQPNYTRKSNCDHLYEFACELWAALSKWTLWSRQCRHMAFHLKLLHCTVCTFAFGSPDLNFTCMRPSVNY